MRCGFSRTEGLRVGLADGAALGLDVGLAVGDSVGATVAEAVGDAVGLAVGLVGDAVTVLPHTNPGLYCAAVLHEAKLTGVLHRALLVYFLLPLALLV